MSGRRGFLALISGGAISGAVLIRDAAAEPTLLLPKGVDLTAAPTILRNEGEVAFIGWYRQASKAERECLSRLAARVRAGNDWCGSVGRFVGELGRVVPRERMLGPDFRA
jgi:hypothetical protein